MEATQDTEQAVILVIREGHIKEDHIKADHIKADHIKEVRIKKNNIKSIIEMDQSRLSGPLFFDKSFIWIDKFKK
jgi:hypothetical protein